MLTVSGVMGSVLAAEVVSDDILTTRTNRRVISRSDSCDSIAMRKERECGNTGNLSDTDSLQCGGLLFM